LGVDLVEDVLRVAADVETDWAPDRSSAPAPVAS